MIIGITGGIGSGKSFVSDYLAVKYGYEVLKTDDIAKNLMNQDPCVKEKLIAAFGKDIYTSEGLLDRKRFASVIYGDDKKLEISDSIVHPACWSFVKDRITESEDASGDGESCIAVETAIPSEQLVSVCDEVWFIYAAPEERIKRLCETRGYTRDYAEGIISKQISDNSYMVYADRLINNGGSKYSAELAVDTIMTERVD